MTTIHDIMSYEYLIPTSIIFIFCLPLLPNKKIRFFTCYLCYASSLVVFSFVLFPVFIMRPMNIVNLKFAGKALRNITKLLGIKWELRNGEILKKEQGAVIAANHQSVLDIMGMFNIWDVLDKCTVIAKKELLYFAPFGQMAWLAGVVFIDRVNPKAAINKINAAAHLLHAKKAKIWLFPEGTRNKEGKHILPFKKGAFRMAIESQVPIIPIVYSPYYFIDGKNKTFAEGKVIISVLDPVSTEGMELTDVDLLKERVHTLMSVEYEKLHEEIAIFQKNNLKIQLT